MISGVAALCVAALVVVTGLVTRAREASEVKTWTANVAVPIVTLVTPKPPAGTQSLTLPGSLQAFYNASIYARVSGYVRAWYVDIGGRVKAGQLLAVIDTPELDQQLIQARADLASAKANLQLADITAKRWNALLKQDAVSKQESDEKTGDQAVKTAQVNAAQANVDRLLALKGFSRIVAPFDGVVTARKTDIGALVNAGAGATTNSELFDVGEVDKLRLYVNVPQSDSAQLKTGVVASLKAPEYPGKRFPATLTTTSNAVGATTGAVLAELMVDNRDGALKAGDFAEVTFDFPEGGAGGGVLTLPSSALIFRREGMEAAVVGADHRVHIRRVSVGRNLGATIEVTAGLSANDEVIDNPSDSLADGQRVRVAPSAAGRPTGGPDETG